MQKRLKFLILIFIVAIVVNCNSDIKPADTEKERKDEAEATQNESRTILILLSFIVLNFFIAHGVSCLKQKWPKAGRMIQVAPLSLLLGIFLGYIVRLTDNEGISRLLRTSFHPLFMVVLLPFIIIDGAMNTLPRVFFFDL